MIIIFIAIIILIICATLYEKPPPIYSKYLNNKMERFIYDKNNTKDIIKSLQSDSQIEKLDFGEPKYYYDNISSELSNNIPIIIYINLDESAERRQLIENEIASLNSPIDVYRLSAIKRSNGAIGCFLSHLCALSHALKFGKDVLILEDDFEFEQDRNEISNSLKNAKSIIKNRWDCIVFGQYVHEWQQIDGNIYRILDSTTTSGYLVNKHYIETLLTYFIYEFKYVLNLTNFKDEYHIDQIQRKIQKEHFWIGFLKPLGGQRAGKSIIGNTFASNSWKSSTDLSSFTNGTGQTFPLKTLSKFNRKRIAICNVATGQYSRYVDGIQLDMHKNFLKGHDLGFFLFTDSDIVETTTPYGDDLHVYKVEHQPWPYPTLMRYHYMLLGKQELLAYDYMLYVDVDYRVFATVPETDIMVDGTFAVKHLHELTNSHVDKRNKLFGSPETNPKSKACIHPNENMQAYVCGGLQGGRVVDYIRACETMAEWIDIDLSNGVMPKWHDESMWNRYNVSYPPTKLLSQSYVYPEECLNMYNEKTCKMLAKHNIIPIMLPIKKSKEEQLNKLLALNK